MSEAKKIIVTGSGGQLGNELKLIAAQQNRHVFTFLDSKKLDITNHEQLHKLFKESSFDGIINCAAYTAVDKAETEKSKAFEVNDAAVRQLSKLCAEHDKKLMHISTDFVFDGQQSEPYTEDEKTNPLSVYGASKLAGERSAFEENENIIIIRTSWLYSNFGGNFFKTMSRLGKEKVVLNVVFDQCGTPTYAHELAKTLFHFLNHEAFNSLSGIFHYSNEGVSSWYDFAWKIMRLQHLSCQVLPIRSEAYPTPAKRPPYSVLDKQKIKKKLEIKIPHWEESLYHCIKSIKY